MKLPKTRSIRVFGVYSLAIAIILSWWSIAFKSQESSITLLHRNSSILPHSLYIHFDDQGLFSVNHQQLKRALQGDFALMGQLIADWDVDAQLLHTKGQSSIKRLPADIYVKSQWLARQLKHGQGNPKPRKLLPQTYAAASFLLALSTPEEIVALPHRMRELSHLYPPSITRKIPLDIDRYNAEKLFLAKPEIAFVAPYSNPGTIQALANQGTTLYMMKDLSTLADITEELISIGEIANRSLEAEMLKIFIDATIAANDNKMSMLNQFYSDNHFEIPRVLFLTHHQSFTVPTIHTITGQLLKRLGCMDITLKVDSHSLQPHKYVIGLDKERLLNLNPDCLIIATGNAIALEHEMRADAAFSQLKAIQKNKLFFVDESVQSSPTQYIALAYHDIVQALTGSP